MVALAVHAPALAQDAELDDPLTQAETLPEAEAEREPAPRNMEEAFPRMFSDPIVQGEYGGEVVPLTQEWTPAQASALALVIRDIGREGLDPADYRLIELMTEIGRGASDRLSEIASEAFVWLV